MSDHYFVRSWEKFCFLITPEELRAVLEGMHHVSLQGVRRDYTESDPENFLSAYEQLYAKLACGDKLVWTKDYMLAGLETGLTMHLDNCKYKKTDRLSVPDFPEPCVVLDTFCFHMAGQQLTTAAFVGQFPENTVGLRLSFPKRTEISGKVLPGEELQDGATYRQLVEKIHSFTKPLRLQIGEKTYRTAIRVSRQAKTQLESFWFMRSNGAVLL